MRKASETLVRCLDARALVRERWWDDELERFARAHGKAAFYARQTIEADAEVHLKVAAWPHHLVADLHGVARCLRDLAQLLSG
jgi:hypothetical protein